jgi:hypothetical protein
MPRSRVRAAAEAAPAAAEAAAPAALPVPAAASAPAAPVPVFDGAAMATAVHAYRELQHALDRAMPDQILEVEGRPFRKKGYWRAVAVAFHLAVECLAETRVVDGQFADGSENFGYLVTYRATSPSGRSAVGDGACYAIEKARGFRCPHPERPGSRRTLHWPAETCPAYDPRHAWQQRPLQATVHNVRSHAHTRAYNRAIANLVGFGEVSAEEVERSELAPAPPPPAGDAAAGARSLRSRPAPAPAPEPEPLPAAPPPAPDSAGSAWPAAAASEAGAPPAPDATAAHAAAVAALRQLIAETGTDVQRLCQFFGVECLEDLSAADQAQARKMLDAKRRQRAQAAAAEPA